MRFFINVKENPMIFFMEANFLFMVTRDTFAEVQMLNPILKGFQA